MFADDMVILCASRDGLQQNLDILQSNMGLIVNIKKTKNTDHSKTIQLSDK